MRIPTRVKVLAWAIPLVLFLVGAASVLPAGSARALNHADAKPTPLPKPTIPSTPGPTTPPTVRPTAPPTPSPTPSKPTATPGAPTTPEAPTSNSSSNTGASIELHLYYRPRTFQCDLWTVVQWQDAFDNWHDVQGWRGELDSVEVDADGAEMRGQKAWWVAGDDLGTGPFRWVIYDRNDRQGTCDGLSLIAASDSFYLPDNAGDNLVVKVDSGGTR